MTASTSCPATSVCQGSLLIVGGGKMGEAILAGLLTTGFVSADRVFVAQPSPERRHHLTETYGVVCYPDGASAPAADTVILAVKPQVLREVATTLVGSPTFSPALVISIAAGISTQTLEALFPAVSVVRVMPNTPLMVACGMSAVSLGSGVSDEEARLVCDMFSCMGEVCLVEERLQDAVVAISGSGPAYFARLARELCAWGEQQGLEPEIAQRLATQTLQGTGMLLAKTGQTPDELIAAVSSPGGTTVAALDAFTRAGFTEAVEAGADAAMERSRELS